MPLTMSDVPSVRLLAGERPSRCCCTPCTGRPAQARWQRLKTAALRDSDGQVAAAVTVIEDLTAVKTAEVHTRVLANSGRILASSLDYEETLRQRRPRGRAGSGRLVHRRADRRADAPSDGGGRPIGAPSARR